MKYILCLVVLMFSFQISFAQADGPFKDFFESGELKIEGQYKNKKRIGNWKNYYENGQISSLYSYNQKGIREKASTSFFKDGTLSNKTEKVRGVYINSGFYKSGKLRYERQLISGYYKSFYESGQQEIEANYLDYELVGEWKQYYESGGLEWIVNYKDGYRDGVYKNFYDNGNIKLVGKISKDKLNGEEKRYLRNNVLLWKGNYSNGLLSKTWIKYDAKGKKLEKIKFINGKASNANDISPTIVAEGVIEKVPIYPGCEVFLTNNTRRKCMSKNLAMFVSKNFNTSVVNNLNLSGRQRIIINFKIDKTGRIVDVKIKAPHQALKMEAIRVVNMLPKFQPGTQRDKPVVVPYSLPVIFQIQ